MTQSTTQQHLIDATGKHLGRVASQAAHLLMGKHRTDAARHTTPIDTVRIEHVRDLMISERKRKQKVYDRYSGYPDGRTVRTLEKVIAQKGYAEVVRIAVYGMLPNNKLRAVRMKKLLVTD